VNHHHRVNPSTCCSSGSAPPRLKHTTASTADTCWLHWRIYAMVLSLEWKLRNLRGWRLGPQVLYQLCMRYDGLPVQPPLREEPAGHQGAVKTPCGLTRTPRRAGRISMEACTAAMSAPWKDAAGHHRKGFAGVHSEVHNCVRHLQRSFATLNGYVDHLLQHLCISRAPTGSVQLLWRRSALKITWSGCMPTTREQSASSAACAGSSHRAGPNSACRWDSSVGRRLPSRCSAKCCALLSFRGLGSIVVHLHRQKCKNRTSQALLLILTACAECTLADV